jgi:hypothetical protein
MKKTKLIAGIMLMILGVGLSVGSVAFCHTKYGRNGIIMKYGHGFRDNKFKENPNPKQNQGKQNQDQNSDTNPQPNQNQENQNTNGGA